MIVQIAPSIRDGRANAAPVAVAGLLAGIALHVRDRPPDQRLMAARPNTPARSPSASSEAVEDYAKAIYALAQRGDGPVGTSELAERLGVTPATATAMLKRLDERGLVRHRPYRGVTLTAQGERLALEVIRHHRLLEAYLSDVMGMPWDRVHEEAEVLEHYISEEFERLIAEKLGDPVIDPHGDPIPGPDLHVPDEGRRCPSPRCGRERRRRSRGSPTPTRACCATSPSAASGPAPGSSSSSATIRRPPRGRGRRGEARARSAAGAGDARQRRGRLTERARVGSLA